MFKTLITNNCWGGIIYNNYGREFDSPTINLQILPEYFPDFCTFLKFYLCMELEECTELDMWQEAYMYHMFGDNRPDCPIGLLNDMPVVFQHYGTFEEAKRKWYERRERVDYNDIGYMFHAKNISYKAAALEFLDRDLPNSICITEGFEIPGAYSFHVPEGMDAFGGVKENGGMRRIIEENFRISDWLEGRL